MARSSKEPNGKSGKGRREPSLADEIAASGETEIDPLRAALRDDTTDRRYLGREFLTWLLYHADDENGGGEFVSQGGAQEGEGFRVQPGERVVLKAMGDGTGEITARGAAPAQMADVRYAVAGGLTVRDVELFLLRGDRTWQFMVNADLFDIKRVKLPELLSDDDLSRAEERLSLTDEMDGMLRDAYRAFLTERLAPSWTREVVPRLRAWLDHSIHLLPGGPGGGRKDRERDKPERKEPAPVVPRRAGPPHLN